MDTSLCPLSPLCPAGSLRMPVPERDGRRRGPPIVLLDHLQQASPRFVSLWQAEQRSSRVKCPWCV